MESLDGAVCRTCLSPNYQLISLKTKVPYLEHITYKDILNYCTTVRSLTLTNYDEQAQFTFEFPTHICLRCSKALQVTYHFLKMLRQTDATLEEQRAAHDLNMNSFEIIDVGFDEKSENALMHDYLKMPGKGAEPESENESNQMKTKTFADVSHEVPIYLQANLNSFEEDIDKNQGNVEEDIPSSFIPIYKSSIMPEEPDSCLSSSSNENCNIITETKDHEKPRNASITPFGCQNCKYATCYTESLRKHYKSAHNIEATLKMLSKSFDPHELNIYQELTHECPECGWQSHKVESVKSHMMYQHSVSESASFAIKTNINCPSCVRKFKDMRGLRIHLQCVHNTEKKAKSTIEHVKCVKCERSFLTKWSLSVHQRSCIDGPKRIDCNLCTKQCETLRQFEAHLCKEHDVEMIHECEVCGKTFKNSTALSLHRKRHSERHFQCNLCPKNYINRNELKVHTERIHKGKCKVICSTCNASFASTSTLRFHENKEHFKKMYKCNYCNYKCSTTTWLKIHQYIHTGMPYKCKMCPEEYAVRRLMRRHSISKHGIELAEDELADMFRQNTGYPNRYDSFGNAKYSLDIPEINEEDVEGELAEYGLKFDDIVRDLFNEENNCGYSNL